jgi:hypothetical protein
MLELMAADMDRHTPETGFNVVGIDDHEVPGEQLYLISHHETLEEAERAATKARRGHGDAVYVYGPPSA